MSDDQPIDSLEPSVLPAEPVRRHLWLWLLLTLTLAAGLSAIVGIGALVYSFATEKPIELNVDSVMRRGPGTRIALRYQIKDKSWTSFYTRIVVEGPGWKRQFPANLVQGVPFGHPFFFLPDQDNQAQPRDSVTIYMQSAAARGGLMDRSSNKVSVTLPPP